MNERIRSAFDGVRAEESLKKSTLDMLSGRANTAAGANRLRGKKLVWALACFSAIFIGVGGWGLYFTPVSAISIDVNPSIELGVNRFDRVVSVTGLDDESASLAKSADMNNMYYLDALERLMTGDEMREYLEGGELASITVVAGSDEAGEKMLDDISSCGYAKYPNVECRLENREMAAEARNAGLPLGKYKAYQELAALDPSVEVGDVQGLTMRQIRDLIDESSPDGENDFARGRGRGRGRGEGGGRGRGGN